MHISVIPYKTMMMYRAKKMVIDDIKRQGHKQSDYSAAELKAMAQMYLQLHPELAQQAKREVDKLILDGAFGKRMQKAMLAAKQATAQLA